jgi:hypothetical protein
MVAKRYPEEKEIEAMLRLCAALECYVDEAERNLRQAEIWAERTRESLQEIREHRVVLNEILHAQYKSTSKE